MIENDSLDKFIAKIEESIKDSTFIKITLSKPIGSDISLKNIYGRLVALKNGIHLSFTFRHETNDIVKNYTVEEGISTIESWMGEDFLNADLFTTQVDMSLQYNRKRRARLFTKKASQTSLPEMEHDKNKKRYISSENNPYLTALGITNKEGKILKDGQRKFRQINKYIEIIDNIINQKALPEKATIVDMGSGKGYLTFALYDYLVKELKHKINITGIELRPNLVVASNQLAREIDFKQLHFIARDINDFNDKIDMLIALHACDIATDIVIAKGIKAQASIIIVAPCCHKQVRKDMDCTSDLQSILQHGILKERQAELLTDGIRALLMEAHGYKTKVFEFISTEHTPKNLMIVGTKAKVNEQALQKVDAIKTEFGIEKHFLEELLTGIKS